jgi:ABC-type hemin transport system ATPase subunit
VAPALETRNITYHRSGVLLLQRVSLCVDRGELLVCTGPAGSGVNTLLRLIGGELAPDVGRVLVDGVHRTGGPADRAGRTGPPPGSVDPRRVVHGPDRAMAALDDPGPASILLLDRPTAGLGLLDAHDVLDAARRRADAGAAVVLTTDDVAIAADRADAIGLVVAGRLLAWGAPAVVLHPSLRILADVAMRGRR